MRQFPKLTVGGSGTPLRDTVPSIQAPSPGGPADAVVEVVAAEVRERFGCNVEELRRVAAAQPGRVPGAEEVLRWFDQLTEAQQFLEDAEDALAGMLLVAGDGPLTEDQMDVARTVDAAVTVRDGRALVVRFLLDPDAPGKHTGSARGEALGVRRPPALTAGVVSRPAAPAPMAGRGARR